MAGGLPRAKRVWLPQTSDESALNTTPAPRAVPARFPLQGRSFHRARSWNRHADRAL